MSLQFAEATFFLFSLEEWEETRNFAYTLTQKNMKKLILILMLLLPVTAMAQKFGYMNYGVVLKAMPEYADAQIQLDTLKAKFNAEAERTDLEFNRKYSEFLDGQRDFPKNILLKRQKELQDLLQNGVKFREECDQLVKQAEQELMTPVTSKLNVALGQVGDEMALEYIINTEGKDFLYIGPNGIDITSAVKAKLGITE